MINRLYIDGIWCDAASGAREKVINPATGDLVSEFAFGAEEDALRAMDAAARAFPAWRDETAHNRAAVLHRIAGNIRARQDEIARVITLENGKPLAESVAETSGCAAWFEWFAEEARRAYGRTIPTHAAAKRLWVNRRPIGVCVAVTPWNFPINLLARKVAAAMAAGCTIVSRPSELTPLSAMAMFECMHDAGIPPGSACLVTGDGPRVVAAMMEHRACRKLSFTGSTPVGKKLMEQASRRLLRLSLELGGHAPLIVFPDVDPAKTVELCVGGKFRNAGQSCIAPTRFYVHETVYAEFREMLVKRVRAMKVGNGLEAGVEMGPMLGVPQIEKVEQLLADAVDKGAKILAGGKRLKGGEYDKGRFFAPTVLEKVSPQMALSYQEIFGPVIPLLPFNSEGEVIAAANSTSYGLAAYVMTRDLSTALRVTESLEYGIIGVNDTVPGVPHAPFGGWKESGIGREGGTEGIDAYLETQFVSAGI